MTTTRLWIDVEPVNMNKRREKDRSTAALIQTSVSTNIWSFSFGFQGEKIKKPETSTNSLYE